MKITTEKPPVWDECLKAFEFDQNSTVFTYGDTLYNPGNAHIDNHLLAHEETHARQQEHDETVAKIWWMRYIADKEFRVSQEVEAYGNQYKSACKAMKDRNDQARYLHLIATHLAGPMYGYAIPYSLALKRIRAGK